VSGLGFKDLSMTLAFLLMSFSIIQINELKNYKFFWTDDLLSTVVNHITVKHFLFEFIFKNADEFIMKIFILDFLESTGCLGIIDKQIERQMDR
jgi:hypothetical protein